MQDSQSPVVHFDKSFLAHGKIIPADDAIHMIRNLWRKIAKNRIMLLREKFNGLVKKLNVAGNEFSQNEVLAIIQEAKLTADWLDELLKHSFSLTISKEILLQLLNQPSCEGVRFYLCSNTKDAPTDGGKFSLVAVGVDEHLMDLNFVYNGPLPPNTKLPDHSFTAEYAFTLGKNPFERLNTSDMDPFTLFKFANDIQP